MPSSGCRTKLTHRGKLIFAKGVVMTTEHMYLLIFVVYMLVNVITDLKYRVTKNYLHYPMSIILLGVSIYRGEFIETFTFGLGALTFFIIYRNLPIHSFGAGDVKMLVNVFMMLSLVSPYWDPVFLFFTSIAIYVFVSMIGMILMRTIKRNWNGIEAHAEAPFIMAALSILLVLMQ